jgi:VWFA-related protein
MAVARDVVSTLALAALATAASAQPTARPPEVRIEAPAADALLSGPTLLRVGVEPLARAAGVTFFVDGRQVCDVAVPPLQCEWDAGREVAAHQIRAVVSLVEGGRIVRTVRTRGLQFAERVDVDAVQVTVTITEGPGGAFVRGVPRSAFRVYEDGRPQKISHFASTDVPLELIVAVDISGSMLAAMTPLKAAVKEFLAAIPAQHAVTLLGFNDTAFALTRKTTSPAERVRAVDRLAAWGATALYDVIVRGIDMLGREAGRKALVVFTDGEDQGSHVTLEGVERRLEASDVTLYMIGQGRGLTQDQLKTVMARLAVPTGGRVFATGDISGLQGAFAALLEELSNQYLLGYQPTNPARDDTWREIRVEVEGHSHVRARQGYRAVPVRR